MVLFPFDVFQIGAESASDCLLLSLYPFAVLGSGLLVFHACIYVHQLLQHGGVVGCQLFGSFQMVEGGLVVGFGDVGIGQGREERGFGGEDLCGAVGYAAYLWQSLGGGSRCGCSLAGAVVGRLAGAEEGVEVVLHPFNDKDAPALVEVGELPANSSFLYSLISVSVSITS